MRTETRLSLIRFAAWLSIGYFIVTLPVFLICTLGFLAMPLALFADMAWLFWLWVSTLANVCVMCAIGTSEAAQ